MILTIINRLKICWEVLTITSKYSHQAQEKDLSVFQHGYEAGMKDKDLEQNLGDIGMIDMGL